MTTDAQGHQITGATTESAEQIDLAVRAFTTGHGDPIAHLDAARRATPECPLAHLGKAWILALANDSMLVNVARPLLEQARRLPLNEREGTHVAALTHAIEGHRIAAVTILDRHLMRYPHDLLAHFAAMLLDAFIGRFHWVADRSARALPFWSPTQPGYGILLSFYGFGLEEAAAYERAEETSRRAAELEPLSYWPHHAVSHVLEMTDRPEEGLAWMDQRQALWSTKEHAGQAHIWWHKALFHIELGDPKTALELYDGPIVATQKPAGISITHAPALLWRLDMLGCDGGDRWKALATAWKDRADGRYCLFADIHAGIAELKAEETGRFEARLEVMRQTASDGTESAPIYRDVGLPVMLGLAAFHRGRYGAAVDHLHPVRAELAKIGGSKAQRDLVEWTLTEAAVRGGLRDVALALAHERLAQRPHSATNRQFLNRASLLPH